MPRGTSRADEMRLQGRMDPDALLYIAKVERADNAALESGVKEAINNFVVACKDTKIWEKLGLVNIMAGARSLTGAITTLKGPISTLANANFTLSDYSRKDGFTGNGTKYFTTNTYWWNAEPLDDYHIAANAPYVDQTSTPVQPLWGKAVLHTINCQLLELLLEVLLKMLFLYLPVLYYLVEKVQVLIILERGRLLLIIL